MKKLLFTVYDSAAAMYLEPFVAPSVDFAIRSFRQAVNTPDHQFNVFPQDYTLFVTGEFDPETGRVAPIGPTSLGVAITFMNPVNPAPVLLEEPEEDANA
jgi:hypothetical protein